MENRAPGRGRTCWKKRTPLEKYLILVTVTSLVVLLALLIGLSVAQHFLSQRDTDICLSPTCIKAAAAVFDSLDKSIDPCDNFYQFSCRKFVQNTIIPDDQVAVSTFNLLQEQLQSRLKIVLGEKSNDKDGRVVKLVKDYYQSCIDTESIEEQGLHPIQQLLANLGGWPVLQGRLWKEELFDWKEILYSFDELGVSTPFFMKSVVTDFKNTDIRRITIGQPTFGLDEEFLVKGINETLVQAYFEFMLNVATELGVHKSIAETELRASLELEIKLAQYAPTKVEMMDINKLYNLMTIAELQKNISGVSWLALINTHLSSHLQVTENENIVVISPAYLYKMVKLLEVTPKRVQANYAIWKGVLKTVPYLTKVFSKHYFKFYSAMTGATEQEVRWKQCVDEVSKSLPLLSSALYIRKYFPKEAKSGALEIVEYIRETLYDILKSLDWMDAQSKRNALDKAKAVVAHIGYPDELEDDTNLEKYYTNLNVYVDQYFQSTINIARHINDYTWNQLRKPVNKTDWIEHGNVVQVNAFYHILENSIMFPAGILQGIFYNKDRPRYMNFAAIGSVIGHELTHGFDNKGRQFNEKGNLANWWDDKTAELFLKKAQCIIEQYGNYTAPGTNKTMNGVITQGENIADNGGIKEAYLAYQSWVKKNGQEKKLPGLDYSPNQLFWISTAMNWCSVYRPEQIAVQIETDSHTISEFRVIGSLSNLNYFSDDFQCPLGSKMNPVDKCSVW